MEKIISKEGLVYRFGAALVRILVAFFVMIWGILKSMDGFLVAITQEIAGFVSLCLGRKVQVRSIYIAVGIFLGMTAVGLAIRSGWTEGGTDWNYWYTSLASGVLAICLCVRGTQLKKT